MPNAWVHAVIDLIVYGNSYFDLHKEKDEPYKLLGSNHRIVNHGWYQRYGIFWDFDKPFLSRIKEFIQTIQNEKGANKAEEKMAWIDHDYIDRIWGTLSDRGKYWEGFFAWVLHHPKKILRDWTGVDVLNGKIRRIINNREVWESFPDLKSQYQRLCKYVESVIKNDKSLQDVLKRYGNL